MIGPAILGAARARTDDIPAGVQDRMLWRSAQRVLDIHQPGPAAQGVPSRCRQCGTVYPCEVSELARKSQQLAREPYQVGMTARHDQLSRRNPRW